MGSLRPDLALGMMKPEVRPLSTLTLRDGTAIPVRPIQPADAAALRRLHSRLSARSSYLRFLHALSELPEAQARRLADVDGFDRLALVALDPEQPDEIVAVVRYARNPGTDRAELAALVEDRWQGRGLGRALLRRLVEAARERGVRVFYALILRENVGALKLLEALGLPERERRVDRGTEHVEVEISEAQGRPARLRPPGPAPGSPGPPWSSPWPRGSGSYSPNRGPTAVSPPTLPRGVRR